MKNLKIQVVDQGDIRCMTVQGFMNMAAVPEFEQSLGQLIEAGARKIVLDFSLLEYISSAGMGEIIAQIRGLRRQGGDLKIGGYSPQVYDILKSFGFAAIFDIYPTPEEAIRKFGQ